MSAYWFFFFFQTSDILYYEVLDIPLPELQGLKTLKVAFHHATKEEVCVDFCL
jgi:ubiquitin carboxyl-terminal hydrolase 7